MTATYLFYVIFLCQILLISWYLPGKLAGRLKDIMQTYPPAEYPKLYPKPVEFYQRGLRRYRVLNFLIILIGLFLTAVLFMDSSNDDWGGVVTAYFMIQFIPMILVEASSFRHYHQMRAADSRTTRKAQLRPRRLLDFVSPALIGVAALVYLAFVTFVLYVRQFDYPWFGGYLNIVILTAANVFFAGIIGWNIYGKKRDPYQAHEDRVRQIKLIIKQMVFISIAATVFVVLGVLLKMFDLHHLSQIATSLYLQLIAVISFYGLFSSDQIDFEVYKEDPVVT